MNERRVYILCNAISDDVRQTRGIVTDSPAATRKIVMMMETLRVGGVRATIVSLGRGRQDRSGRIFPAFATRINGIPIAYGRFVQRPFLSQVHSLFAPLPILWSRRRHAHDTTLVLYNRMFSHIPALWFARALGYRTILDLEDGEVAPLGRQLSSRSRLLIAATDRACRDGALVACSALASTTRLRPVISYYGVVVQTGTPRNFAEPVVHALIGGTVGRSTGADMLIAAIELLRDRSPDFAAQLHLHVTGYGDMLEALKTASLDQRAPRISVHGRLTNLQYEALLNQCDVGLALKPNRGGLASTTFPSKVMELAGAGMLVLTTDISDVRDLLRDDGAVYLTEDDPQMLCNLIIGILRDRERAARIAHAGQSRALERCGRSAAAIRLADFLTGSGR